MNEWILGKKKSNRKKLNKSIWSFSEMSFVCMKKKQREMNGFALNRTSKSTKGINKRSALIKTVYAWFYPLFMFQYKIYILQRNQRYEGNQFFFSFLLYCLLSLANLWKYMFVVKALREYVIYLYVLVNKEL